MLPLQLIVQLQQKNFFRGVGMDLSIPVILSGVRGCDKSGIVGVAVTGIRHIHTSFLQPALNTVIIIVVRGTVNKSCLQKCAFLHYLSMKNRQNDDTRLYFFVII